MPITKGISDYFSKLEEIEVSELQEEFSLKEDGTILENRLGNKILYPQVVPQSVKDALFNSIIIRKVIKLNLTKFYNKNLKKIDIPEEFLDLVPDLQNLTAAFIDTIKPSGITTICIKSGQFGRRDIGTLLRPDNLQKGGFVTIGIKGQQYQIETDSLVVISIPESRADITFSSTSSKLLGKKIISTQIVSGKLGLIIDARV